MQDMNWVPYDKNLISHLMYDNRLILTVWSHRPNNVDRV